MAGSTPTTATTGWLLLLLGRALSTEQHVGSGDFIHCLLYDTAHSAPLRPRERGGAPTFRRAARSRPIPDCRRGVDSMQQHTTPRPGVLAPPRPLAPAHSRASLRTHAHASTHTQRRLRRPRPSPRARLSPRVRPLSLSRARVRRATRCVSPTLRRSNPCPLRPLCPPLPTRPQAQRRRENTPRARRRRPRRSGTTRVGAYFRKTTRRCTTPHRSIPRRSIPRRSIPRRAHAWPRRGLGGRWHL